MKKLIGILSVFLILATSVNLCSAARDVYVCTNYGGEDIYVDVDSIVGWPEEFQASVTIGKKGRYVMSFVTLYWSRENVTKEAKNSVSEKVSNNC